MIGKRSRLNRATMLKVYDRSGALARRPYLTRIRTISRVTYPDNTEYRLQEKDTWSNIAYRFLGDSYLWWVVCEWNRVVDPWEFLRLGIAEGRTIIIPSINRVNFTLLVPGRARRS